MPGASYDVDLAQMPGRKIKPKFEYARSLQTLSARIE
jgi:hypothetical protein